MTMTPLLPPLSSSSVFHHHLEHRSVYDELLLLLLLLLHNNCWEDEGILKQKQAGTFTRPLLQVVETCPRVCV